VVEGSSWRRSAKGSVSDEHETVPINRQDISLAFVPVDSCILLGARALPDETELCTREIAQSYKEEEGKRGAKQSQN